MGAATVLAPVALSLAASIATSGRGDYLLYRNVIVAWLPLTVVLGLATTLAFEESVSMSQPSS